MSVSKLATSLTVIFTVTVVILAAELLFILFRRRRIRRSSQPQQQQPINNQNPNHSTKELLYFFCMKTQTRVEPSGPSTQNPDGDSGFDKDTVSDDTVIDVFKMLEENGRPCRVLCTIKEDDREDGESTLTTISGVETVSLQECFEAELAVERGVKADVEVDDGKTVFSFSPCDSPLFFTPIGSPTRDGVSPVIVEKGDYGR